MIEIKLAVYHQNCPKLPRIGGSPQMLDITKSPDPHPDLDRYRIYKCEGCGLEIQVRLPKEF
jgi:hypothetical protein